jgi:hypothetical protein
VLVEVVVVGLTGDVLAYRRKRRHLIADASIHRDGGLPCTCPHCRGGGAAPLNI